MKFLLLAALLALPVGGAGGAASSSQVSRVTLNAELIEAAGRGDAAMVRALLARGASADARRPDGRTALTAAALGDHVAAARLLVDAGADPDPQDQARNNALLVTGETGSVAMLREVLRARPDLTRTNRFGGTALIPAADRGHVEYVREILKTGINVNHVNNLGWTALLEAVILGDGGAAPHRDRPAAARGGCVPKDRGPGRDDSPRPRPAAGVHGDGAPAASSGRPVGARDIAVGDAEPVHLARRTRSLGA